MDAIKRVNDFFVEIGIPYQVVYAIIAVIFITEFSKDALAILEKYLEEKKGKEIKFFDHTKIVLVTFWSIIASIFLAVSKIIGYADILIYSLAITGISAFSYDVVIKKVKKKLEDL